MKKILLLSLTTVLFISSCTNLTNRDVGTVSGGVVGGLLGSQIGGGSGQIAAGFGGALLGAYLGGRIGQYMDRIDRMEMQHVLESAPTGKVVSWKNPDTGNRFSVQPTKTYYKANNQNQPCREYTTNAIIGGKTEQIYGKACRQADGSWRVVY